MAATAAAPAARGNFRSVPASDPDDRAVRGSQAARGAQASPMCIRKLSVGDKATEPVSRRAHERSQATPRCQAPRRAARAPQGSTHADRRGAERKRQRHAGRISRQVRARAGRAVHPPRSHRCLAARRPRTWPDLAPLAPQAAPKNARRGCPSRCPICLAQVLSPRRGVEGPLFPI